MLSEQFIQDAVCQADRIESILHCMRKNDWHFLGRNEVQQERPWDVIDQEVNFSGGRIDVVATFGGRRKLAIVEVKAGIADGEDLGQLDHYVDKWTDLPLAAMALDLSSDSDVVGILLAESFRNIREIAANVALVAFALKPGMWPFRIVDPAETLRNESNEGTLKRAGKVSGLYDFTSDWAEYIQTTDVRYDFMRTAYCCLPRGDSRLEWVLQNPKSGHVAIHYKGMYIAWLGVGRKFFDVGYHAAGEYRSHRVDAMNRLARMASIERDFSLILTEADKTLANDIPAGFSWRTVKP